MASLTLVGFKLASVSMTAETRHILGRTTPVTYVAFDLLHLDGQDVITRRLVERKKRLKSIVKEGPYLLYGDHIEAEEPVSSKSHESCFEGVIGKESQTVRSRSPNRLLD